MKREEILRVYHQGPEAVVKRVSNMAARIQELAFRSKKNATNSHKPPSTDRFVKLKTRSLRSRSDRKTGGQHGHKGHTLPLVKQPHHVVRHPVVVCSSCEGTLVEEPVLRGKKAMDHIGLLPAYRGIIVHDGWASY